jgi:DNA-binding NarL/FixJ family response regulator
MPLTARVLAAADTYQSKIERRPHRPALDPGTAAEHLHAEVRQRRLDGDAVAALLRGARHVHPQRTPAPRLELTDRELEVLGLLVRGLTNREMSEVLVVSPKTVGHHVESIYRKLGVSTRAGATIFAVSRGLVGLGQQ